MNTKSPAAFRACPPESDGVLARVAMTHHVRAGGIAVDQADRDEEHQERAEQRNHVDVPTSQTPRSQPMRWKTRTTHKNPAPAGAGEIRRVDHFRENYIRGSERAASSDGVGGPGGCAAIWSRAVLPAASAPGESARGSGPTQLLLGHAARGLHSSLTAEPAARCRSRIDDQIAAQPPLVLRTPSSLPPSRCLI